MTDVVTIARGDSSRIAEPRRVLVRSSDEWRALWALHAGPDTEPPPVDFDARVVAAAFAGERPSAGYGVEIVPAPPGMNGVRLGVDERSPARGTLAAQIMTSPFHIVTVPRGNGDVTWAADAPTAASARPATGASSTGLDPRTASLLAYLAGPFSGAVILLAESSNDNVRFHAWQSILALGGVGLIVMLGYLTALAALFISATAVSFIVRVSTVLWILLIALWAICLWKAFSGGRWKLPIAGDLAERLALRRP